MKRTIASISLILLGLLSIIIPAIPARAYLITPSSLSIPVPNGIKVFRNLAETGDLLYVFNYDIAIPSDNFSSTPASDSFMFRLYASDGTTRKATTSPYVFPFFENNGYSKGVSSFYISASDNQTGLAWGSGVSINFLGTPAFYSPTQNFTYQLTPGDYVTVTTQEDNRAQLKTFVLLLCDRLQSAYASSGVVLKSSSDSGIVLSSYGDMYFQGAIPGLPYLCPDLFYIQVLTPTPTTIAYDMSAAINRIDGGDLERGFKKIGQGLGVSTIFAEFIVFAVLCFALTVWVTKKGWGIELGAAGSTIIGGLAAFMVGDWAFALMMIFALAAGIGLVWLLTLKRA